VKGDTGVQGIKGDTGSQGLQGLKGDKGDKGDTGAQGTQGPQGLKGDTGAQGLQGLKGDTGDQGVAGANGTSCVNPDGSLTSTLCRGPKGDTGATGAAGPQGQRGPAGATGFHIVSASSATVSGGFGAFASAEADCPNGEIATGGGASLFNVVVDFQNNSVSMLISNYPVPGSGTPFGWKGTATGSATFTQPFGVTAYAICATIAS
jgi:hypothetical protein